MKAVDERSLGALPLTMPQVQGQLMELVLELVLDQAPALLAAEGHTIVCTAPAARDALRQGEARQSPSQDQPGLTKQAQRARHPRQPRSLVEPWACCGEHRLHRCLQYVASATCASPAAACCV